MKILYFSLLFCFSANMLAQNMAIKSQKTRQETYKRVEIRHVSAEMMQKWLQKGIGIDHIHWRNETHTAFIAELSMQDISAIEATPNIEINIQIDDLAAHYAHQNDAFLNKNQPFNATFALPRGFNLGSMGGYLSFAEYMTELDSLHNQYPNLVSTKFSIGTTIEGRDIWAIKISDNVANDEAEPEVLIDGLIHAREGVAGMQSLYFIYDLLEKYTDNDAEARFLVNNREIFLVPVINPDGYVYNENEEPNGGGMWRKNRRDNGDGSFGIDLNRNFAYFWGFDNSGSSPDPSSDLYRGTAGFSEPETQALRDFVNSRNFKTALNHHTYSNLMIRPFGYNESVVCPDEEAFTLYGPILTEQNGFLYGKPSQTVGYNVNGSTDDWMYGETTSKPRIISFTPETGSFDDGFWPPLERIVPLCQAVQDANTKIVWLAGEYFQGEALSRNIYNFSSFAPFDLRNLGQTTSLPLSLRFVSTSPYIAANQPIKNITSIASLQQISDSVAITLNANTPNNAFITGDIQVTFGGFSYNMPVDFVFKRPVSTTGNDINSIFTLSPNPVHDQIRLSGNIPITSVRISDLLGRTISIQQFNSSTNATIDVHDWQTGIYFIQIYDAQKQVIGAAKWIKE